MKGRLGPQGGTSSPSAYADITAARKERSLARRQLTERNMAMTTTKKCIGSAKFGIEAHEAPIEDFPVQASSKDGLGRMCRPHWTAYTRALRAATKAIDAAPKAAEDTVPAPTAKAPSRRRVASTPQGNRYAPALDGGGQSPD